MDMFSSVSEAISIVLLAIIVVAVEVLAVVLLHWYL